MKTIILFLFFLFSKASYSQIATIYEKIPSGKAIMCTGTRANWVEIVAFASNVDTSAFGSYYNSPTDMFIGSVSPMPGNIVYKLSTDTNMIFLRQAWSDMKYNFSFRRDSTYLPYVDNYNGYMTVSTATPIIASMTGSINANSTAITAKCDNSRTITFNGNSQNIGSNPSFTFNAGTTYSAGNGISISSGSITNSAPDQTISLSGTGAINITGTYPNFTINIPVNTSSTTVLTASTGISLNGTSPNYTISSPSQSLSINSNSLSISGSNTIIIPTSTLTSITASTGISITSGSVITNTSPNQTVTLTGIGLNVTSAYPSFTVAVPTRTMSTPTRSLNTSYTISAISDYNVNYSVYAQVTSAVAGTNTADVYLEISPNNSTWTTISRSGISVAGVLSTSGNTQTVGGFVPAGYYVRIRSAATGANSGAAVFTYQNGQENSY